ncbi:hypothetical protein BZB76_3881 [Actinomadura pelletieri DSM 43383]|uniref:Uncharacterized protein n=1 Tax=Actinomadura pelletieri DSM 43383 TaxID=1120940 RepID=A0A495QL83_9ACTN|nr:hypothetical protein BZB76_3881 [Actinomadura pelletieri DSM 43383]
MAECEKCGLTIGLGCACNLPTAAPRRPYENYYQWTRFGPDALLISSRNMAHVPGACSHIAEDDVLNPESGWGWIPDPDPALWDRISADHPVPATEGNTSRAAVVRCADCLNNL